MERRFAFLGDTVPGRPAELRPILRRQCQRQQAGKRGDSKQPSAIHGQAMDAS